MTIFSGGAFESGSAGRVAVQLPFGEVVAHMALDAYVDAVASAGAIPLILPCLPGDLHGLVGAIDGVVLTGGRRTLRRPDGAHAADLYGRSARPSVSESHSA